MFLKNDVEFHFMGDLSEGKCKKRNKEIGKIILRLKKVIFVACWRNSTITIYFLNCRVVYMLEIRFIDLLLRSLGL